MLVQPIVYGSVLSAVEHEELQGSFIEARSMRERSGSCCATVHPLGQCTIRGES